MCGMRWFRFCATVLIFFILHFICILVMLVFDSWAVIVVHFNSDSRDVIRVHFNSDSRDVI